MRRSTILKRAVAGLMAAALCLSCSACGSSAGKYAKSYLGSVGQVLSAVASKSGGPAASAAPSASDGAVKLDTPTRFTVDGSGSFSFQGVDGASFYLIYFCDTAATGDGDDYLYASSPIYEDGSGSYTGQFSDLFQAAYGEYLVKVFAFPELTDASQEMSGAATASYTYTGAQSDPVIDYFWDTNGGAFEAVLTNVADYTYQAYPDAVELTFTNTGDPADVVAATLEGVSESNTALTVDGLTRGGTYRITAVSRSGSPYVTNAESAAVTVSEGVTLGDVNVLSENYTWSDGWASFPRLTPAFDLNGGSAGTLSGRQGAMTAEAEAVPAAANAGCDYSYTIRIDFGGFAMDGALDLKSDGTLEFTESGAGPIAAGAITGSWVDNGDGTATLSYAPAEIKS